MTWMPRCQPSRGHKCGSVDLRAGKGAGGTCNLRLTRVEGGQGSRGGGREVGEHESLMIEAQVSQAWPLDY